LHPNGGQPGILEPPDVKITTVNGLACPAKKDIGRGLHHALADHNPFAMISVVGRSSKRREDRLLRLFNLKQKR
jgi:hypothetical protein